MNGYVVLAIVIVILVVLLWLGLRTKPTDPVRRTGQEQPPAGPSGPSYSSGSAAGGFDGAAGSSSGHLPGDDVGLVPSGPAPYGSAGSAGGGESASLRFAAPAPDSTSPVVDQPVDSESMAGSAPGVGTAADNSSTTSDDSAGSGSSGATQSLATQSPATHLAATDSPVTDSPVTDSPVTDPPVTDSLATDPPATDLADDDLGAAPVSDDAADYATEAAPGTAHEVAESAADDAAQNTFGPGSALPLPDGSSPGPEYTIKGNADSMKYHTPESPFYQRTRAEVWFSSVEAAEAAGFAAPVGRQRADAPGSSTATKSDPHVDAAPKSDQDADTLFSIADTTDDDDAADHDDIADHDDTASQARAPQGEATGVPTGAAHADSAPDSDTGQTTSAPASAEQPYGAGSALPLPDGSSPGPEYTIKGNADSMKYHTTESPSYGRTKAEVWFSTTEAAEAAGFVPGFRRRST